MKSKINSVIKELPGSIGEAAFDANTVKTLLFGCGFKVLGWEFQRHDLECEMIISHNDECFATFSFNALQTNKLALEVVASYFKD